MAEELECVKRNVLSPSRQTSGELIVVSSHGFHARPAATLVKIARKFRSEIKLTKGKWSGNAKNLVSVVGLALQRGDRVSVLAEGPDADLAMRAITAILTNELETSPSADKPMSSYSKITQPIIQEATVFPAFPAGNS